MFLSEFVFYPEREKRKASPFAGTEETGVWYLESSRGVGKRDFALVEKEQALVQERNLVFVLFFAVNGWPQQDCSGLSLPAWA